jgi:hypothetical protein
MVKSEEGPACPTCRKHYGDIVRHGTKRHPYEMGNDKAWIKLLAEVGGTAPTTKHGKAAAAVEQPKEPPKPSVKAQRQQRWESKQPYAGTLHLFTEAFSWDEANDTFKDALDQFKRVLPKGTTLEYEQTRERF